MAPIATTIMLFLFVISPFSFPPWLAAALADGPIANLHEIKEQRINFGKIRLTVRNSGQPAGGGQGPEPVDPCEAVHPDLPDRGGPGLPMGRRFPPGPLGKGGRRTLQCAGGRMFALQPGGRSSRARWCTVPWPETGFS